MKVLSVFIFLPVLRDIGFGRTSGLEAAACPLYMYPHSLGFKKGAGSVTDVTKTAENGESVAEAPRKVLTPAAERALAEAEERRRKAEAAPAPPREINGRGGKEPTRYGDWEVKGIISDF
jgi:hypothetical protein